jgi:hypothetical protein
VSAFLELLKMLSVTSKLRPRHAWRTQILLSRRYVAPVCILHKIDISSHFIYHFIRSV